MKINSIKLSYIRIKYIAYTINVNHFDKKGTYMLNKLIDRFLSMEGETPNSFTRAMGELIREARKEAHMSQAALAKKIYKRQAAISDMENGKVEPNASTLLLLSYALGKPIGYFYPRNEGIVELYESDLQTEEQELIFQARRLEETELPKLIAQIKALADLADAQYEKELFEEMAKARQEQP